jgi:TPR repeat protein
MKTDEQVFASALKLYEDGNYWSCVNDFLKLSSNGDAKSSFYAANIFLKGGSGVPVDQTKARQLYSLALEHGSLPGAALSLALMEYKGWGGPINYADSMRHYSLVKGNPFAKIMIGEMLQRGLGCGKDEAAALRCYDGAWSLGHPLGLRQAAYIRMRRGNLVRGLIDYLKGATLMVWFYGIRRISVLKSPYEVMPMGWKRLN